MDLFDTDQIEQLLESLENYQPAFPDALVRYYLGKAGFQTNDLKAERLIALAAQKFVADVANDALNHSKLRQQSQTTSKKGKDNALVLTLEDLSKALAEYGIHLKKPPYYVDSPVVSNVVSVLSPLRKSEQPTTTEEVSVEEQKTTQMDEDKKTQKVEAMEMEGD
eukprot:jgi/Galph1/545/GphlegSOOS_G5212.1